METGKGNLTKQEWETVEMFVLFEAGVKNDLLLKTHVKEWEYLLYGGRPELYPQDRKAILTMLKIRQDQTERNAKKQQSKVALQQRLAKMRASGFTGMLPEAGE